MNRLRFAALAIALFSLAAFASPARAEQKIGYVNPQRVVNETRLGQAARADLNRYVQDKERTAKDSASQVAQARREAEAPGLSVQEKARREDVLRRRAAQHETLMAENARDIKAEEGRLLQYVMRRAEAVLEDIGKKGGYSLILIDPSAVGYVDKGSVDITDRVVKELDIKTK